jgi:Spy/CpxP family protein refolding chaperone
MKPISHVLCIALLAVCPGLLIAKNPAGDPIQTHLIAPDFLMRQRVEIGLTDQQIEHIRSWVDAAVPIVQHHETQLDGAMGKLTQILAAAKIDENAAIEQLDEVLRLEKEVKRLHLRVLVQVRNELNAEQRRIAEGLKQRPRKTEIQRQRLKAKIARIEMEIQSQSKAGTPPNDVIDSLQKFPTFMQKGQVEEAEALLDHLLEILRVKDVDKALDSTP